MNIFQIFYSLVVSRVSRASSSGRVKSINYNGARSFLDQCLEVNAIHFPVPKENRRNLPPPVIPPSTEPPSFSPYSTKARETGKCLDFSCFAKYLKRDLRQINKFRCRNDNDCRGTEKQASKKDKSAMICREFSSAYSTMKFCDCPKYMAYNPLSCECEPAEQCGNSSKVCLVDEIILK